jgi:hypothetical protein
MFKKDSHIYCKNTLKYLIELLRNSLDKENQRLPSTISVFLAETILVIIEPGTTLYKPIMSFLLLKPTLDLTNVPEFYKLFNSSALQVFNFINIYLILLQMYKIISIV